jgi:hypothetical protein
LEALGEYLLAIGILLFVHNVFARVLVAQRISSSATAKTTIDMGAGASRKFQRPDRPSRTRPLPAVSLAGLPGAFGNAGLWAVLSIRLREELRFSSRDLGKCVGHRTGLARNAGR